MITLHRLRVSTGAFLVWAISKGSSGSFSSSSLNSSSGLAEPASMSSWRPDIDGNNSPLEEEVLINSERLERLSTSIAPAREMADPSTNHTMPVAKSHNGTLSLSLSLSFKLKKATSIKGSSSFYRNCRENYNKRRDVHKQKTECCRICGLLVGECGKCGRLPRRLLPRKNGYWNSTKFFFKKKKTCPFTLHTRRLRNNCFFFYFFLFFQNVLIVFLSQDMYVFRFKI